MALSSLTNLDVYEMSQVDNRLLETIIRLESKRRIRVEFYETGIRPLKFKNKFPGTKIDGGTYRFKNLEFHHNE